MQQLPMLDSVVPSEFDQFEMQFKALADKKRLHILYELCQRGKTCVCDLSEVVGMPQSKLSYHLKILLDAGRYRWPAIRWNGAESDDGSIQTGDTVNLLYHVTHHGTAGQESLQLIVLEAWK